MKIKHINIKSTFLSVSELRLDYLSESFESEVSTYKM